MIISHMRAKIKYCSICGALAKRNLYKGRPNGFAKKCEKKECSERYKTGFQKGHKYGVGRKSLLGRKTSEETKLKMSLAALGKKKSVEHRLNISKAHKGANSFFWKGGVTPLNKIARESVEYKLWREEVYKRDNWTCRDCKVRGGKLNPHHIKPFSLFPELRFVLENGVTLCEACHKKTDTYGSKIQKYVGVA